MWQNMLTFYKLVIIKWLTSVQHNYFYNIKSIYLDAQKLEADDPFGWAYGYRLRG